MSVSLSLLPPLRGFSPGPVGSVPPWVGLFLVLCFLSLSVPVLGSRVPLGLPGGLHLHAL